MAMKRDLGAGFFIGLLIVASAILYVVAIIYTGGEADLSNLTPNTSFMMMKILVTGAAVFFAWQLIAKVKGTSFTMRDFWTLVILTVILWFLWDKILSNPRLGIFSVLDKATGTVMSTIGMV